MAFIKYVLHDRYNASSNLSQPSPYSVDLCPILQREKWRDEVTYSESPKSQPGQSVWQGLHGQVVYMLSLYRLADWSPRRGRALLQTQELGLPLAERWALFS